MVLRSGVIAIAIYIRLQRRKVLIFNSRIPINLCVTIYLTKPIFKAVLGYFWWLTTVLKVAENFLVCKLYLIRL